MKILILQTLGHKKVRYVTVNFVWKVPYVQGD